MGSLRKIWRLGVKELRSLSHDPVLLGLIAVSFTLMVYTAAKATRHELRNAPIAVVDHDRSQLSERIVSAFYLPRFKTPARIADSDLDAGLDSGLYTFVLDIPPDFQRDVLQGRQPEIQVNIDATRMSQAYIGAGYIQNIVHDELGEFTRRAGKAGKPPFRFVPRMMFNPNLEGVWFGGVMELINQVTLISIIRRREQVQRGAVLVVLPFVILSGAVTPRESMPRQVATFMLSAPTTHYVSLAQAILYRGAGIEVVWPQFCALIAIGSVAFLAALARLRRSVSLG